LKTRVWREITPDMRTRDSVHRKNSPFFGPERFTYLPESKDYRCPAGQPLNYGGRNVLNRTYAYIGTQAVWFVLTKSAMGCVVALTVSPAAV
jgi:hypothetical protein